MSSDKLPETMVLDPLAAKNSGPEILVLEDVTVDFGPLLGLENINLQVKKGEIHGQSTGN